MEIHSFTIYKKFSRWREQNGTFSLRVNLKNAEGESDLTNHSSGIS